MTIKPHWSEGSLWWALLLADEAAPKPVATRHQMMKECMAKQKASDAGLSKEQMKKNCRDVTETERENAKADQKSADQR
jgi:hypothetical protein